MFGSELNVAVFNYAYVMICVAMMGIGVMFVRESGSIDAAKAHFKRFAPVAAAVAIVACAGAVSLAGLVAVLYVTALVASFCAGALIEFAESDPARAKAALKAILVECGRQWGKVPTSH